MNDAWYYRDGELQYGPMPLAELQRLIREGRTPPTIIVSSPYTQGQWMPVAQALAGNITSTMSDRELSYVIPTAQTSGLCLAAGYLGLFSLVMCLLAPGALVLGILGLRDLKAHPQKNGTGCAITGIVIGSLGTVGMVVWLILVLVGRTRAH